MITQRGTGTSGISVIFNIHWCTSEQQSIAKKNMGYLTHLAILRWFNEEKAYIA